MSKQHGKISLMDFIANCEENITAATAIDIVNAGFSNIMNICVINVEINDSECKSLIFIGGYVGFKIVQDKITCDLCTNELVKNFDLNLDIASTAFSYLRDLDCGRLKWPTDLLVEIVTQVFLVFRCIVSENYKGKFLELLNNRSVFVHLAADRLTLLRLMDGVLLWIGILHNFSMCCKCSGKYIFK